MHEVIRKPRFHEVKEIPTLKITLGALAVLGSQDSVKKNRKATGFNAQIAPGLAK